MLSYSHCVFSGASECSQVGGRDAPEQRSESRGNLRMEIGPQNCHLDLSKEAKVE